MIQSKIYDDAVQKIQDVYTSCSPLEQKQLRQILQEIALTGDSQTLENIWLTDFKEIPVSIDRFLSDPYYLGSTNNMGKGVYPFWRESMNDIFTHGNRYSEIVLSGATRIGKTSTMVSILAYMLYRLMLYRNPHEYFKKKAVSRFTIAFANLTKDLAFGVAYREYNDTLKDCPFFQDHGRFTRSDRNFYYVPEGDKIDIVAGSDAAQFLGMQVWAAGVDECNFAKSGVKDINIAKTHMKHLYDTINARISGTFRIGGEVYGKMVTSSSKNTDSDFLSSHIESQLSAGNTAMYLVDRPQWEVLPKSMFSDEVFHFTVGDRYKRGFVIPPENDDEEHRREYEEQGYEVVEAPAEFRKNFIADYDIALRDIAGRSVVGAMGFITQEMVTVNVTQERQNPFFEDILMIGKDDDLQIADFFHDEVVPSELKCQKINIHLDLAETENRTGIGATCVAGTKVIETEEGKKVTMPYMKEVFAVAVQAPRGTKQSFQKVINFILWLRQHHYNIGIISTDQYQSDFLRETLSQQGFETMKISIERTMEPYIGLRNLLVDQRIELIKCELQETELIATERINNKISHPIDEGGGHGDVADGLCGSCWTHIIKQTTPTPPPAKIAGIAAAVNTGRGGYGRGGATSGVIVLPTHR